MIGSKKPTTDLKEVKGRMSDNLCRDAAYLNQSLQPTRAALTSVQKHQSLRLARAAELNALPGRRKELNEKVK